jgi:BirA family transcriptional regulator, biotin operon repressor / biotin---[acetyl-CoA-carboxylase] ligase
MSTQSLDIAQILATTFVAEVEYHATLTSTNDRAAECAAEANHKRPLLIVADQQTAGRGRGVNRWWTGSGSLAFSLLLDPRSPATDPRHRSLVALAVGVAVAESLGSLASGEPIGLHWPNDVMAGDRKLAGVLIEVLPNGQHIVGVGVNTNNTAADAPAELRPLVATLRDLTGTTCDSTVVLTTILQHLERLREELASTPELIAAKADRLCLQRGKTLTVSQGETTVTGQCLGIRSDGALVLETPDGQRPIHSGVVQRH